MERAALACIKVGATVPIPRIGEPRCG